MALREKEHLGRGGEVDPDEFEGYHVLVCLDPPYAVGVVTLPVSA